MGIFVLANKDWDNFILMVQIYSSITAKYFIVLVPEDVSKMSIKSGPKILSQV